MTSVTMFRMRLATILAAALTAATAAQAQSLTLPLWPHGTPEPAQTDKKESQTKSTKATYPGVELIGLSDVTVPTMTLYPAPAGHNTGAAALVFPGGGYLHLSYVMEGVMPCQWFNSIGMTCLVVKYRVPFAKRYPEEFAPLEDAQQAMRLTRAHAKEWHIDADRIGVMGYSAGGHLAVTLSQHFDDEHVLTTPAAQDVDAKISARPDFAILGYPAYLPVPYMNKEAVPPTDGHPLVLDPALVPNKHTPPTFIVQAEDDHHYVDSALTYTWALKNAQIPVQLAIYPSGGHGFGMGPHGQAPEHWSALAEDFLHIEKILK